MIYYTVLYTTIYIILYHILLLLYIVIYYLLFYTIYYTVLYTTIYVILYCTETIFFFFTKQPILLRSARICTVDLHILTSFEQLLFIMRLLFLLYKTTYLTEEYNHT